MAVDIEELPLPDELPEIPRDWRYESLGDLVEERGISYGIVQPGSDTTDGVPIVRVNNIRDGRIDTTDVLKVGADIEAKFQRSRLRGGEVLLTLVGTLGEVAIVPDELHGWNVARAVGVIPVRKDPGSLWVSICLRSAFVQHCIRTWATTTVQATFNLRDMAKLPIPIPPTETREAIAAVLGALDDKIELNRRMNATLEAMARALFQSWFVDFDPVRAKLDGRKPTGLDEATAALFPEHLEDTPLGHIPTGWKAGSVVDGFTLTMGQSPPGDTYNEEGNGLPFYQGRTDFGFRFPTRRIYCTAPTRYAKPGDTLVSVRAPVGDINMANEECCIGRGVAAVRHKSGATSFTYHSMANLYPDFARFEAEGTVFGSINKDGFEKLPFVIPPAEYRQRFLQAVTELSKTFALAVPHDQALAIRDDVGFFQAVRAAMTKGGGEKKKTDEERDHAIRQIISRAVASNEVVDIFAAAGLKKPDISILSDQFLAEVRGMPQKNLAVELLRKLLGGEIKLRSRKFLIQSKSFAGLLEQAIRKYQNRAIEAAAVIEELIQIAKGMRDADQRGEDLGLSEEERAFYDALADNESAVQAMGSQELRVIATELVTSVRNSVTIDWTLRESARAKIKVMVKRILRKHGYPPDLQDQAVKTVLAQAELLCADWAT